MVCIRWFTVTVGEVLTLSIRYNVKDRQSYKKKEIYVLALFATSHNALLVVGVELYITARYQHFLYFFVIKDGYSDHPIEVFRPIPTEKYPGVVWIEF